MTGENQAQANQAHENQAHENHALESQAQESKAQERKKPAEPSIRFTRGILKTTPGRSAGLYDTIRIDYESARRYLGKLGVTLYRTIRRPDGDPFVPPPNFGLFPIYPAAHFGKSFSPDIIKNCDCIVPMYRRSIISKICPELTLSRTRGHVDSLTFYALFCCEDITSRTKHHFHTEFCKRPKRNPRLFHATARNSSQRNTETRWTIYGYLRI